jgi:hypothetical protein
MVYFGCNALIVVLFVWLSTRKYGTLLNPVGFFGGFYLMASVVGPLLYQALDLFGAISKVSINFASVLSSIYFASIGIAFTIPSSPFRWMFDRMFRFIRPFELKECRLFAVFGMLCQFVLVYSILMVASGAGLLWITNSREAYQAHKSSVGVFYSLGQATLLLTFISAIFLKAKNFRSLFLIAIGFSLVAQFLGSKGSTLAYFVLALFYGHFRIKRISNRNIVLAGTCILGAALGLQMFQGTAADMLHSLLYFDYFRSSAAFLDRFHEFGFRRGALSFSDLWYYVPRGLYHAKPYVYGQMTISEMLYPGGAEEGFTAGIMPWTEGYADFGVAAVVLYGLYAGFVAKGAYELFLERKDIQSMALLTQVGMFSCIELFPNAPFVIFLIWLMAEAAFVSILSMVRVCPPIRFTLISKPPNI